MHDDEFVGKAMTLTKTTARNAKDTTWRRVIGLRVDTLWELKRLASSTSGGREGVRRLKCLGERALLGFKDDVLETVLPKARVGGAA
jgi:hypothetical protein